MTNPPEADKNYGVAPGLRSHFGEVGSLHLFIDSA